MKRCLIKLPAENSLQCAQKSEAVESSGEKTSFLIFFHPKSAILCCGSRQDFTLNPRWSDRLKSTCRLHSGRLSGGLIPPVCKVFPSFITHRSSHGPMCMDSTRKQKTVHECDGKPIPWCIFYVKQMSHDAYDVSIIIMYQALILSRPLAHTRQSRWPQCIMLLVPQHTTRLVIVMLKSTHTP